MIGLEVGHPGEQCKRSHRRSVAFHYLVVIFRRLIPPSLEVISNGSQYRKLTNNSVQRTQSESALYSITDAMSISIKLSKTDL